MESRENKTILVPTTLQKNIQPALFLDRDGVIIEDKHYLSNPSKVELCNGIKDILKSAYENGFIIVIITPKYRVGSN